MCVFGALAEAKGKAVEIEVLFVVLSSDKELHKLWHDRQSSLTKCR